MRQSAVSRDARTHQDGTALPLPIRHQRMEPFHAAGESLTLDRIELHVQDLVAVVQHGGDDRVDLPGVLVLALERLVQELREAVQHHDVYLAVFGREACAHGLGVLEHAVTPVLLRLVFELFFTRAEDSHDASFRMVNDGESASLGHRIAWGRLRSLSTWVSGLQVGRQTGAQLILLL